ncbi:conserved hypothetical protein [Xenorhabdus nematophila F1]|uniref:Uncharacterized protein n=1 Tax=Xenorhabdus nematophila (strain ATCC 19061 / DSM 3370 / CCUG 14189 / LMG 1036 / NCIMB 9965 / AN6) TaxID=406817 RepID=D3VCS1_XENNA|nr:hypothetical protein XNC1_4081 [Xenorhabdus nematophila ATCC 19061]CCW30689.1 conserved hypothetical protein [Xenorhabdus nematophila F1]CEE91410.1 hypothetical protein XNA1_2080023 [Xenorhabdus nematophila str. Anatoliense]CEF33081.1 hypothetical protein XNW1_4610034 [Xenorhabdus nematophila str. Websteri]CEK24921.1 hypothetical protein XNC2_3934 [Xenorhabdus nematophila AN6/1]
MFYQAILRHLLALFLSGTVFLILDRKQIGKEEIGYTPQTFGCYIAVLAR